MSSINVSRGYFATLKENSINLLVYVHVVADDDAYLSWLVLFAIYKFLSPQLIWQPVMLRFDKTLILSVASQKCCFFD